MPGNITEFPEYTGYIGTVVATLFFGSNYAPVKRVETGDGLFFQFIFCIALWLPSVILNAIRGFPRFWPLAMLGGVLWCTGNILVIPILQCIGMGMGLLIWSSMNMLAGWASGSFGWFGTTARPANNLVLNYFGVGLCFIGAIFVAFIKPTLVEPDNHTPKREAEKEADGEKKSLIPRFPDSPQWEIPPDMNENRYGTITNKNGKINADNTGDIYSLTHRLSPTNRTILGVIMCLIAGFFFGLNFTPVIYIKDNYGANGSDYKTCTEEPCLSDVSPKDVDYVFSHFTGILLTSAFYFIVYCFYMKSKPRIYPKAILPGLLSGVMWSLADISWFLANETLNESVSFPIISTGPPVVASLWGWLVFKEIQGKRNISLLFVAYCFIIGGCVLTGVSKS